jgi:hypothetical protein
MVMMMKRFVQVAGLTLLLGVAFVPAAHASPHFSFSIGVGRPYAGGYRGGERWNNYPRDYDRDWNRRRDYDRDWNRRRDYNRDWDRRRDRRDWDRH